MKITIFVKSPFGRKRQTQQAVAKNKSIHLLS